MKKTNSHNTLKTNDDPVYQYARMVVDGEILACKTIVKTCQRHLNDLEHANERGYVWDLKAAMHAINFFRFCRHYQGEWAGTVIIPEPWEKFIVGSIFGWKKIKDGYRRFRTAYIEIPRKNGKSLLIAVIGNYLFIADGEPGCEVYSAATKLDQAKICHKAATKMIKKSPTLSKIVKIYKNNLNIEDTGSKFEPVGADADTLDGLNIHGGLVDELHAHKSRAVWDVLDTATGARRQPLIAAITTAGFDQSSICYEQHTYALNILDGVVEDDTFFAYLACMDEEDDWTLPITWQKCNPNYGISVKEDDLRRLCNKAMQVPSFQNAFLCKRLDKWVQQANRWINLNLWDANNISPIVESALRGKLCYGGLDLSTVSDLTCWTLGFPRDDDWEIIDFIYRIWCPESRIYDKANQYHTQYEVWAKKGYLKVTPGNAVDYEFIKKQILEDMKAFRIKSANVDRLFQGHQIAMQLQGEGLEIVPMGMGFTSFAAPMVEFERRLLTYKLNHGGHPIARFAINNMSVLEDAAGNKKPDKASSQGKIDPVVTMVMALDRIMREPRKKSIYETRGVITL